MDKLEKLFRENKTQLDQLIPAENTWSKIQSNLRPKNQSEKSFIWKRWAAVVTILLGFTAFLFWDTTPQKDFNNLALNTPNGTTIPLNPSKNKLTLVQFWESGNTLCTSERCYYLPSYEKYKALGFEIYAISLDKDRDSWEIGIEDNDMPWIHVSDLLGWDSPIVEAFDLQKLPASYLVDKDGKVIAKDLDAAELEATLEDLLVQN